MHRNHAVYKGYRLTARVTRPAAPIPATGAPMFSAVVTVLRASEADDDGEEYSIPRFVDGDFVYSPAEAVHAAVEHGRQIVDALMGQAAIQADIPN